MNLFRTILKKIEKKRNSKNLFLLLLVWIKDILWFFCYYIVLKPFQPLYFCINSILTNIYLYFKLHKKNIVKYHRISFCITCMNRVEHIKKTLGKNIDDNIDYPDLEFVLLDYNSSDDLQEWVFNNFKDELASGKLVYYQTKEPKYFHMANAKNIAHHLATGDIVCNLDADNYTGEDFAFYINKVMQNNTNIIGRQYSYGNITNDTCGRIFLTKENFLKLGGYDEEFIGWSYEDSDLIERAYIMGLDKKDIPFVFLKAIPHSDNIRSKNMNISIEKSYIYNDKIFNKNKKNKIFNVTNKPIDFTLIKRIQ